VLGIETVDGLDQADHRDLTHVLVTTGTGVPRWIRERNLSE
jgi:hypothetical protein